MRIVYKDGVPCKVDSFGRLVPSKTKPLGGRYMEETVCIRIPISIAPQVLELCNKRAYEVILERVRIAETPNYTTPGFENAEVLK